MRMTMYCGTPVPARVQQGTIRYTLFVEGDGITTVEAPASRPASSLLPEGKSAAIGFHAYQGREFIAATNCISASEKLTAHLLAHAIPAIAG